MKYETLKKAELESNRIREELVGQMTDLEWRALPSDEKWKIIEKCDNPIKVWVEQNPLVNMNEILNRLKKITD